MKSILYWMLGACSRFIGVGCWALGVVFVSADTNVHAPMRFGSGSSLLVVAPGVTVDLGFNQVHSLADPTSDQDAATKKYVDDNAGGGGVPTTRILTINGTAQDLSADRTWTVVSTIGFTTDGSGSTVTTGVKGYFTVHYAGTITGWSITAVGTSPTCTIDVWKIAAGTVLPTVTNTITASAKPALATGNAIKSTTLSGWTTSVSNGDIFGFNVDAVSNATKITFELEVAH